MNRTNSEYFRSPDELSQHEIFPGVHIHTAGGDQLMISIVDLAPGAVVEMHNHPHEQMGVLLAGELDFTIGDERRQLRPGDVWRIPGGVPHGCQAGSTPVKAIDFFHPIREDYL